MALPATTPTSMLLDPSNIHIEVSSRCVLKCPRCPRTELDLDYLNQDIDVDLFKRTFPANDLHHIRRILFCGHVGDPIYSHSLIPIVRYIKDNSDIEITIITNGSYRKEEFWEELGLLLDENDSVTFSVDGWDQDSNHLYRVNSNFESIINGIHTLRQSSRCKITWSLIYFQFNQDRIPQIRNIAKDAGCDFFVCVRSSKFDNQYAVNGIDQLKPRPDLIASSLLYERDVENFTDREISKSLYTPRQSHAWAQCANHVKEPFLDIRGLVLPCAWSAGGYQQNKFLNLYRDRLDIHNRTFIEILEDQDLWNQLKQSWDQDPMPICKLKCKNAQ